MRSMTDHDQLLTSVCLGLHTLPCVCVHALLCRDLKPANLMIGGSYIESDIQRRILLHELGTVKIADFGKASSSRTAIAS